MLLKGIKLRWYPNRTQQIQLNQMFGNDRFVWNQMLAMAEQRYRNNPSSQFVNEYGMNYLLKVLKQEHPFLRNSDSTSLQVVTRNLAQAFKMLFKHRGGHPRFKSHHASHQGYTGCWLGTSLGRRAEFCKLGIVNTHVKP